MSKYSKSKRPKTHPVTATAIACASLVAMSACNGAIKGDDTGQNDTAGWFATGTTAVGTFVGDTYSYTGTMAVDSGTDTATDTAVEASDTDTDTDVNTDDTDGTDVTTGP